MLKHFLKMMFKPCVLEFVFKVSVQKLSMLTEVNGKKYDTDDSSSIISTQSVTDLFASIRGGLLLEISREEGKDDDIAATSKDNEQNTRNYLNELRCFDKYFAETNFFRKAIETLEKEGVAVLTGKPGNGKTSAAVHIMLSPSYRTWIKRKFTSWSDFKLIDTAKDTLVFIDNIYDGNMYSHELDKWWDTFSNVVYESQKNQKGKVHILITAKENVIDKACEYMRRKTSVFREKFIIRTEEFELSSKEKEGILEKQIEYAKAEKGFDPPKIDPEFKRELKNLKSIIGFPLCAHLYACVKEYRDSGIHFFQEPVQYIRKQIKYEIDVDRTDKVKSLFLVMFLHQMHGDMEGVCLKDPKECVKFLKEYYSGLIDDLHLKKNSFTKLLDVANGIKKLNLIAPIAEGIFVFKHQTICQAVGHYFFTENFDEVLKYFPIEAFVCEEFVCSEEKEFDNMASRLYREVTKGNHSKVFSCGVFMNRAFGEHFCSIIENSKNVRKFLLIPGDHSLPLTFWVRKNHLFHLSASIQSIIERHANQDAEHHFYLARFGECCADDENVLKKTDTSSLPTLEEAKTIVLNYRDGAGKSIIHMIVSLEIPDMEVFTIINHLLSDMNKHPLYTSKLIASIREESILTAIANHNKNSRLLTILTLLHGLISFKK